LASIEWSCKIVPFSGGMSSKDGAGVDIVELSRVSQRWLKPKPMASSARKDFWRPSPLWSSEMMLFYCSSLVEILQILGFLVRYSWFFLERVRYWWFPRQSVKRKHTTRFILMTTNSISFWNNACRNTLFDSTWTSVIVRVTAIQYWWLLVPISWLFPNRFHPVEGMECFVDCFCGHHSIYWHWIDIDKARAQQSEPKSEQIPAHQWRIHKSCFAISKGRMRTWEINLGRIELFAYDLLFEHVECFG
jgi:hypothetical protein